MANNKQQTAVEWFIEELEYKGDLRETPSIRNIQLNIDTSDYMELKVQAKAMHKEEHFNTWWHSISENEPITFEQYYEQTYGGGEQ